MTTPSPRLVKLARWLAAAATIGMFVVLIMGATVTNTGSQSGCGKSWPLCNGKFVPSFAVSTMIEFSHRFVTSIETVLILSLATVALMGWRQRKEVKILVPVMVFMLFLQAGLGAWAVMRPQSPEALASHFGVSLTAFASVLLMAAFIFERGGYEKLRDLAVSRGYRRFAYGVIIYIYLLVYLGAYVRHSNASMACIDWPLCNGKVYPGFSGAVGVAFAHRLAALAGAFLIAGLLYWSARLRETRPDLYWASIAATVLVVLQSLSGAVVVWSRLNVFSTLAHAGLVTLLFGSLSYICYHVLPLPQHAATPEASEAATRVGPLPVGSPVDR
jgi:cytochrome c oxidase assembly protein subunit 15